MDIEEKIVFFRTLLKLNKSVFFLQMATMCKVLYYVLQLSVWKALWSSSKTQDRFCNPTTFCSIGSILHLNGFIPLVKITNASSI